MINKRSLKMIGKILITALMIFIAMFLTTSLDPAAIVASFFYIAIGIIVWSKELKKLWDKIPD